MVLLEKKIKKKKDDSLATFPMFNIDSSTVQHPKIMYPIFGYIEHFILVQWAVVNWCGM